MDVLSLKVVIWDLDDTFWSGTLSEGKIEFIPRNIELIKRLTDKGIVNTICSKNNKESVMKVLEKHNIAYYFVFSSIDWTSKGMRIQTMLKDMNLRCENALFIDDNVSNLEEASYYCKGIHIAKPEICKTLWEDLNLVDKEDKEHKRLQQYKLLEKKNGEKDQCNSNEEFLHTSNIRLQMKIDCINELDRIHELIIRTNQLNYTKNRCSKEELQSIISNPNYKTGYIKVQDNYGDYGIVGFYAVKNYRLEHFLFSCRTMGMGIEQYVYAKLNYPALDINGEVANLVNKNAAPEWINKTEERQERRKNSNLLSNVSVLAKGPCDIQQVFEYIGTVKGVVDIEYSYVNTANGVYMESHNSTTHIVQSIQLSQKQKDRIINEIPFGDASTFETKLFQKYHFVFYSLFTDAGHGLYRRKDTGELLSFGEYLYDLTDEKNWQGYITGAIFNANCAFSIPFLKEFKQNYEYIGRITVDSLIKNLTFIRENMNIKTNLVLFLGSEMEYVNNEKPAYNDRHVYHKKMNDAVRRWSQNYLNNVLLIDFNQYLNSQAQFFNNINHFAKPVYYMVAQDISQMINSFCEKEIVCTKTKQYMIFTYLKQRIYAPVRGKLSVWKKQWKKYSAKRKRRKKCKN